MIIKRVEQGGELLSGQCFRAPLGLHIPHKEPLVILESNSHLSTSAVEKQSPTSTERDCQHYQDVTNIKYHAPQPPHGPDTLTLPEGNELLCAFFVQCTERHEFQSAQSEREQVRYCAKWRERAPIHVSLQNLADIFKVSKSTIQYHISRPFDLFDGCEADIPGRPSLFTPEQMQELFNYIEQRFNCRIPVSYEDIREFSEERWGIVPHSGTLRSIIGSWEAVKLVECPWRTLDCKLMCKTGNQFKIFTSTNHRQKMFTSHF